ncbi:hypothetical protein QQZ08_006441 [Neonectria magnoliae]|uniref:Uncharacterized protein n=1 Tax=Neonectria magnoliae TaxID=2732573 RepID=A0ABR1I0J1_9HYPO
MVRRYTSICFLHDLFPPLPSRDVGFTSTHVNRSTHPVLLAADLGTIPWNHHHRTHTLREELRRRFIPMSADPDSLIGKRSAPTQDPAPAQRTKRRRIIVNETITAEDFVQQHKAWLDELLEPFPRMSKLLPRIFRHITKESIRFLPGRYNDRLHRLFLNMGDVERGAWCVQSEVPLGIVGREIAVSARFDLRKIADVADRMWQIGHFMRGNGAVHGVELQRMSWQLEALLGAAQSSDELDLQTINEIGTKEQKFKQALGQQNP